MKRERHMLDSGIYERLKFRTKDGRDYYDVFPQDKPLLKKRKLNKS